MAGISHRNRTELTVGKGQALVSVPDEEEDGKRITRLFVVDVASRPKPNAETLSRALSAIGAWSDLDWDETIEALDRIRHESKPTPPIELDDIL